MDKETTPKKFYQAAMTTPSATTTGDLIEILKELPEDAPLEDGGYEVVVYNISGEFSTPFVSLERID